ncbi:MAG: hypothetical protein HYT10_01535 [Candidatus Levybacteria bacterium]|nr:hypothetical protein [Candidatus Levybacteria bacterium]
MKQPLILIDIDNTLFDSGTFRQKLFTHLSKRIQKFGVKITPEICQEIYNSHIQKYGLFVPDEFINALLENKGKKEGVLEIIEGALFDTKFMKSHFYQETFQVLEKLSAIGTLGIFSQGNTKFQNAKIKSIKHFFHKEHIHIVENKKNIFEKIISKYDAEKVYLIDDFLSILFSVKKRFPNVTVIWMKRGRYAAKQEPIRGFIPDATVTNLQDALPLIKEK